MIRRPPESTRTDTRFPTRRASDLADVLEDGPPALVAVMLANNETGVLQPVAGIAATAHAAGALLHCDAVQAAGRVGVDRSEEHTSELQSLMRISYAVSCLKKKKTILHMTSLKKHQDTTHLQ